MNEVQEQDGDRRNRVSGYSDPSMKAILLRENTNFERLLIGLCVLREASFSDSELKCSQLSSR